MKFENKINQSVRTPRFHAVGDTFVGQLLTVPPDAGTPKIKFGASVPGTIDTYDDGSPKKEWIYDAREIESTPHPAGCYHCTKIKPRPADDVDNGHRRLYANNTQKNAIKAAFKEANDRDGYLATGGTLVLRFYAEDTQNQKSGQDAPRLYKAVYKNPEGTEEEEADAFLAEVGGGPIPWKDQNTTPAEPVSSSTEDMLDVLNGRSNKSPELKLPSGKTLTLGDLPKAEPEKPAPRKRAAKAAQPPADALNDMLERVAAK